ncbi:Elongation of fatty acids protein 3-like [Glycine soja]|uniref:Elongation of fatty acids protein 3-like n=1 Tax=Glycine soja TaxID=3848 RepID=A0A445GXY9_GLYSO|nr:Elongation of fatty acids protein 3-like [Glycine soja]
MHSSSPPFLPLCCHLHYRSRLGLDCRQNQRDMTALAAPQDRSSGFYVSLLVPVPLILRRFSSGPTFSTCRVSFTCCTPSSSSYDVFSQSFQVLTILFTTLVFSVMLDYRLDDSRGAWCMTFIALLGCNLVCHVTLLLSHFLTGGCNGIGAWVFNSVLNGAILLLFLNFLRENVARGGRVRVSVIVVRMVTLLIPAPLS